jgi:hypothetical protein
MASSSFRGNDKLGVVIHAVFVRPQSDAILFSRFRFGAAEKV